MNGISLIFHAFFRVLEMRIRVYKRLGGLILTFTDERRHRPPKNRPGDGFWATASAFGFLNIFNYLDLRRTAGAGKLRSRSLSIFVNLNPQTYRQGLKIAFKSKAQPVDRDVFCDGRDGFCAATFGNWSAGDGNCVDGGGNCDRHL